MRPMFITSFSILHNLYVDQENLGIDRAETVNKLFANAHTIRMMFVVSFTLFYDRDNENSFAMM